MALAIEGELTGEWFGQRVTLRKQQKVTNRFRGGAVGTVAWVVRRLLFAAKAPPATVRPVIVHRSTPAGGSGAMRLEARRVARRNASASSQCQTVGVVLRPRRRRRPRTGEARRPVNGHQSAGSGRTVRHTTVMEFPPPYARSSIRHRMQRGSGANQANIVRKQREARCRQRWQARL